MVQRMTTTTRVAKTSHVRVCTPVRFDSIDGGKTVTNRTIEQRQQRACVPHICKPAYTGLGIKKTKNHRSVDGPPLLVWLCLYLSFQINSSPPPETERVRVGALVFRKVTFTTSGKDDDDDDDTDWSIT